jgi:hypothetical protein
MITLKKTEYYKTHSTKTTHVEEKNKSTFLSTTKIAVTIE